MFRPDPHTFFGGTQKGMLDRMTTSVTIQLHSMGKEKKNNVSDW